MVTPTQELIKRTFAQANYMHRELCINISDGPEGMRLVCFQISTAGHNSDIKTRHGYAINTKEQDHIHELKKMMSQASTSKGVDPREIVRTFIDVSEFYTCATQRVASTHSSLKCNLQTLIDYDIQHVN